MSGMNLADCFGGNKEAAELFLAATYSPNYSTDKDAPAVIEFRGRFYINMGRPGFNSRTNNGFGYATAQIAQDVIDGKRSRFA